MTFEEYKDLLEIDTMSSAEEINSIARELHKNKDIEENNNQND